MLHSPNGITPLVGTTAGGPLAPRAQELAKRVEDLNARYKHHSATSVIEAALRDPQAGKVALVSSFGAESVVLLHYPLFIILTIKIISVCLHYL